MKNLPLFCAFFSHRQVTLFEEYMLLKEFEKRENSFANKVNTKLSEKEEMQEKVRWYSIPRMSIKWTDEFDDDDRNDDCVDDNDVEGRDLNYMS